MPVDEWEPSPQVDLKGNHPKDSMMNLIPATWGTPSDVVDYAVNKKFSNTSNTLRASCENCARIPLWWRCEFDDNNQATRKFR